MFVVFFSSGRFYHICYMMGFLVVFWGVIFSWFGFFVWIVRFFSKSNGITLSSCD